MQGDIVKLINTVLISLFLALSVSGCGTPAWFDRSRAYSDAGNCDAALNEVYRNAGDPGKRALVIGAIYAECKRDKGTAIKYFTLAARYGEAPAPEFLVRLGAPVPPADLARADASGDASALMMLNAAVQGYNAGRSSSPVISPMINCRSVRSGNTVNTDCY